MLGLGIGLHKNNFVGSGIIPSQAIINAFKTRVATDSGTFEAESCLLTYLNTIAQ